MNKMPFDSSGIQIPHQREINIDCTIIQILSLETKSSKKFTLWKLYMDRVPAYITLDRCCTFNNKNQQPTLFGVTMADKNRHLGIG
jgi:hypothetical protein